MAAPIPEFFAANGDFTETGESPSSKFGEKVKLNDISDVFILLTRAVGLHGNYYWGSGVVVEGENGVYLATAGHK